MAHITFYKLHEAVDHEVSKILYLQDEKILVVASNSIIYLYDEIDSENSILLKFFIGAHEEAEITALAYCTGLNLLATGSFNGIVNLWDLQLSKLVHTFFEHSS